MLFVYSTLWDGGVCTRRPVAKPQLHTEDQRGLRRITIRCTRRRGPRGFFCLHDFRRGPVNVAVITLRPHVPSSLEIFPSNSFGRHSGIHSRSVMVRRQPFCVIGRRTLASSIVRGKRANNGGRQFYSTTLFYRNRWIRQTPTNFSVKPNGTCFRRTAIRTNHRT